jgi:hypothetical protein
MRRELKKITNIRQVVRFNILVEMHFKVVLSRDVVQLSLVDTSRRFRIKCFSPTGGSRFA